MRPRLSKYEILGRLAQGGMADVWLARSVGVAGFSKVVVLKTILPHVVHQPGFTEMFLNEGRVAALLNHPNCVQIFDLGQEDGTYFLAMEMIDGFALSRVLKRAEREGQLMPVPMVARVAIDAAAGLDHAHRLKGADGKALSLVHRDISPENILVSFNGASKVVDFGIAKPAGGSDTTQTGHMKGKPGYMAPEYLRGEPIDGRADLFALGAVLYRALTGSKPFSGHTDALVLKMVLDGHPPSPRLSNRDIPAALDGVVMRLLAKEPRERFASARELRAAIADACVPAESHELGEFLEALWPVDDPERSGLNSMAAGQSKSGTGPLLAEVKSGESQVPQAATVDLAHRASPGPGGGRRRLAIAAGIAVAVGAGVAWRVLPARLPVRSPPPVQPIVAVTAPEPSAAAPDAAVAAAPEPAAPVPAAPVLVNAPSPEPAPARPFAARKAVKAPASARGKVEIACSPPADVLALGQKLGRAPGTFELAVGEHRLALSNPALGLQRDVDVTIESGKTAHLQVQFSPAWLEVRVSPWAEVKLDGRDVGSTPVPTQQLYEGTHVIELSNPELNQTRKLTVHLGAGERKVVREHLE